MKKAFISGFTGMVGSHLADLLLENTDWEVHGLLRWRSPLDNVSHLLERVNAGDRVFLHYGDINDEASMHHILSALKPDFVFHLAAQSYPQTSFDSPVETLNTNITGTCRVLETLRILKQTDPSYQPVIHVCASSEVFGKIPAEKKPETGIHEDCPFHPASPYAISKVGTDLLGRYYAEAYGMTVMTTRMFTHTGPRRGDVFHESTFACKNSCNNCNNTYQHNHTLDKIINCSSHITTSDYIDSSKHCHQNDTYRIINTECHSKKSGKTIVKRCCIWNQEHEDNQRSTKFQCFAVKSLSKKLRHRC